LLNIKLKQKLNNYIQQNDNNTFNLTFQELKIETIKEFIHHSNHRYATVQKVLCFAIIARIYRRVKAGYYFGPIRIDEEMIIDGNYRYIAYRLAEIDFEIVRATRSHCDELKSFNDIVLDVIEDWDANHPDHEKYCTDDFLKEGNYRRN